ncbi:MAG: hypothetical protein JWR26_1999 [Pedosphaera sp.]|nr:hypothetical protein [Pedosphaera sp.]
MRRVEKTLLCLLGATALVVEVRAAVNDANGGGDNPYGAIVQRNIFDLKAPDISNVSSPPPAPPLNVKLTGLTTIMGYPQALFMVTEPPAPGKPPNKEESFIMVEGERQGALELVKIDVKAGKAQIKNDGIASTIALEVPKAASPGTVGQGMPGGPPGMMHPGFAPGAPGGGYGHGPVNGAMDPMQTRTPRNSAYNGSPSPTGSTYPGGLGQPQTTLGTTATAQSATTQPPAQQGWLNPVDQVGYAEEQRQQLLNQGNPMAAIIPPLPGGFPQPGNQQPTQQSTPTAPAAQAAPPLGQTIRGNYNFSR